MGETRRIATLQIMAKWVGGLGGFAMAFLWLNFFLARAVGRWVGGRRLELVSG